VLFVKNLAVIKKEPFVSQQVTINHRWWKGSLANFEEEHQSGVKIEPCARGGTK